MTNSSLLDIDLCLFDGTAAADGLADGGNQGDTQKAPGSTRRGKSGEYKDVLFGKQEKQASGSLEEHDRQPSDAGKDKQADVQVTSSTLEDKRKAFLQLVNGEYKDVYTEDTQRIIDRRFKETKNLERQVSKTQPVIDMLMQRYQIADGDLSKLTAAIENDDVYWSEAAEEAGMSVDQYKQFLKLQRENAQLLQAQRMNQSQQAAKQQLEKWYTEGEQVKTVYPDFDLAFESKNPQFLSMLKAGVPVQHAYEVIHMDEIKEGVARNTARQTEKQVIDGIRAKGSRPPENGTSAQSAFVVKDDVTKLSKKDRAEIAKRVARGEIIKF